MEKGKATRKKRKKPKFLPQIFGRKKRIKKRWRRPRGIDSKLRIEKKYMGKVPKIGWRTKRGERGVHPSGFVEILVNRPEDLKDAKGIKGVIRIAKGVGKKKRAAIVKKAKELGLRVLNP